MEREQTSISRSEEINREIPEGAKCQWCHEPEPATHKVEMLRKIKAGSAVGTGQFLLCCDAHLDVAERTRYIQKPR